MNVHQSQSPNSSHSRLPPLVIASDFTFTFHFHALEKEMATHSSVLAWRIPGTGEPGRLPSMGSHRVGHDWSDLAAAAVCFLHLWLYFYFANKFICTVFLDSTYKRYYTILVFLFLTYYMILVSRSIHVSVNGTISFLSMIEQYSIVYVYYIFFIYSSVDGHSGCFHVPAIENSAAKNSKASKRFPIIFSL